MPGLVPGIHVLLLINKKAWMAGTSPAMTNDRHETGKELLGISRVVTARREDDEGD
jgi:hypothetical protein